MAVDQDDVKNNKEKGQSPLGLLSSGIYCAVGSHSADQPVNHTHLLILNRRCLAKQKMLFIHSICFVAISLALPMVRFSHLKPEVHSISPLYFTPCKR